MMIDLFERKKNLTRRMKGVDTVFMKKVKSVNDIVIIVIDMA